FGRIALHSNTEPFSETDDFSEIPTDFCWIDVNGADDLQARPRRDLVDDGCPDWSETKVHDTNNWHGYEIIVEPCKRPTAGAHVRIDREERSSDGGEFVADTPHGQQQFWICRIGLDPSPQPFHQRVHGT